MEGKITKNSDGSVTFTGPSSCKSDADMFWESTAVLACGALLPEAPAALTKNLPVVSRIGAVGLLPAQAAFADTCPLQVETTFDLATLETTGNLTATVETPLGPVTINNEGNVMTRHDFPFLGPLLGWYYTVEPDPEGKRNRVTVWSDSEDGTISRGWIFDFVRDERSGPGLCTAITVTLRPSPDEQQTMSRYIPLTDEPPLSAPNSSGPSAPRQSEPDPSAPGQNGQGFPDPHHTGATPLGEAEPGTDPTQAGQTDGDAEPTAADADAADPVGEAQGGGVTRAAPPNRPYTAGNGDPGTYLATRTLSDAARERHAEMAREQEARRNEHIRIAMVENGGLTALTHAAQGNFEPLQLWIAQEALNQGLREYEWPVQLLLWRSASGNSFETTKDGIVTKTTQHADALMVGVTYTNSTEHGPVKVGFSAPFNNNFSEKVFRFREDGQPLRTTHDLNVGEALAHPTDLFDLILPTNTKSQIDRQYVDIREEYKYKYYLCAQGDSTMHSFVAGQLDTFVVTDYTSAYNAATKEHSASFKYEGSTQAYSNHVGTQHGHKDLWGSYHPVDEPGTVIPAAQNPKSGPIGDKVANMKLDVRYQMRDATNPYETQRTSDGTREDLVGKLSVHNELTDTVVTGTVKNFETKHSVSAPAASLKARVRTTTSTETYKQGQRLDMSNGFSAEKGVNVSVVKSHSEHGNGASRSSVVTTTEGYQCVTSAPPAQAPGGNGVPALPATVPPAQPSAATPSPPSGDTAEPSATHTSGPVRINTRSTTTSKRNFFTTSNIHSDVTSDGSGEVLAKKPEAEDTGLTRASQKGLANMFSELMLLFNKFSRGEQITYKEVVEVVAGATQGLAEGRLSEIINDRFKGLDDQTEGKIVGAFCLLYVVISVYRTYNRSWQRGTVVAVNKGAPGAATDYDIKLPGKPPLSVSATALGSTLKLDTSLFLGRPVEVLQEGAWVPGSLKKFLAGNAYEVELTAAGAMGTVVVVAETAVRIVNSRPNAPAAPSADNAATADMVPELSIGDIVHFWADGKTTALACNTLLDCASAVGQVTIVSLSQSGVLGDGLLILALQMVISTLRLSISLYQGEVTTEEFRRELGTLAYELTRATAGGMSANLVAGAITAQLLTFIGLSTTGALFTGISIGVGVLAYSFGVEGARWLDDRRALFFLSRECGVGMYCSDTDVGKALKFRRKRTHPDRAGATYTGVVKAVYGWWRYRWYDVAFDGGKDVWYAVSHYDSRLVGPHPEGYYAEGQQVRMRFLHSTELDQQLQAKFERLIDLRMRLQISDKFKDGFHSPLSLLRRILQFLLEARRAGREEQFAQGTELLENANAIVIANGVVTEPLWNGVAAPEEPATTAHVPDIVADNVQQAQQWAAAGNAL